MIKDPKSPRRFHEWLSVYKDPIMAKTVVEYVDMKISSYSGSNKNRRSLLISSLSHSLADIALADLNIDSVISLLSSATHSSDYRELILFLICLCKSDILPSSEVYRLIDFEDYFNKTSISSGKAEYILSDSNFDKYKSCYLYKTQLHKPMGYAAYFQHIDPESMADNKDYTIINAFFQKYKLTYIGSARSFAHVCDGIKAAAKQLFEQKNSNELTAQDVVCAIETLQKKYASDPQHRAIQGLFLILTYYCSNNYITDANIVAAITLYLAKNSAYGKVLINVLQSNHPKYWCIIRSANGKHANQGVARYINVANDDIRESLDDFLRHYDHTEMAINTFCEFFESSVGHEITSFESLDFNSYVAQLRYFSNSVQAEEIQGAITAYYVYIYNHYDNVLFQRNNIPNEILSRRDLFKLIMDGYIVINYNPLEKVPADDKWLLCFHESRNDITISTKAIDFNDIKCLTYRNWIKSYIWNSDKKVESKTHPYSIMRDAVNYIYGLKTGEILSYFVKPSSNYSNITVGEANAYKNHILSIKENNRTQVGHIYELRNLLIYVQESSLGTIDATVFYNLTHTANKNYENANPLPDKDLQALVHVLKEHSSEKVLYAIYFSVCYLALETEFREKTILSLPKDCIHETAKSNEYVLVTDTKTSGEELQEQPITLYTVREIKELIRITEAYRTQCSNASISSRLIIVPAPKKGLFKKITPGVLNDYLAKCCEEAGIPKYTMANLRDTHMTNAERQRIKKALSEMEQNVLTGHRSSDIDDQHYVNLDIREMLESVHGVVIGNVDLEGQIKDQIDPNIATASNEVSNQCGYCSSPTCNVMTYIDCLMCRDFVTTVDRLPFFEKELETIDQAIQKAEIPHDKEDLVNIKRLLLRYIEVIINKKEAMKNA